MRKSHQLTQNHIYKQLFTRILKQFVCSHIYMFVPHLIQSSIILIFQLLSNLMHQHQIEIQGSFEAQMSFVRQYMACNEYSHCDEVVRDNILKERIKKFYANGDRINVANQHFKARIEPVYEQGMTPSENTLYLFGIDFMKKDELRNMFKYFQPGIELINQSSCFLKFTDKAAARQAIKANVKNTSQTRVKVQDEDDEVDVIVEALHLNKSTFSCQSNISQRPIPRGWIQLRPYTYRHFYLGQIKFSDQYQDYQRKLFVRYATKKQIQYSQYVETFIDNLVQKCKKIWQSELQRCKDIKQRLQKRITQMKERQNTGSRFNLVNEQQRARGSRRSRSREKGQTQNISKQRVDIQQPYRKEKGMNEGPEDDLSMQIKCRSEVGEFGRLVDEFDKLNISFMQGKSSCAVDKSNYSLGVMSSSELSYKIYKPSGIRHSFTGKFNYKDYVEESIEQANQTKNVAQYIEIYDD